MRAKWALYTGIILLTAGILIRKFTHMDPFGLGVIITGVLFKIYYVIIKIKSGEYKPGYEVGILAAGLILFLTGIYLRTIGGTLNPAFLLVPGITLKVGFVVLFIRKIRLNPSADGFH